MEHPYIPLEDLQAQVAACRRCPLCDGRTQTVFGVGNPEARVLIVGEAPGKNEDLQGEPFVGAAGSTSFWPSPGCPARTSTSPMC